MWLARWDTNYPTYFLLHLHCYGTLKHLQKLQLKCRAQYRCKKSPDLYRCCNTAWLAVIAVFLQFHVMTSWFSGGTTFNSLQIRLCCEVTGLWGLFVYECVLEQGALEQRHRLMSMLQLHDHCRDHFSAVALLAAIKENMESAERWHENNDDAAFNLEFQYSYIRQCCSCHWMVAWVRSCHCDTTLKPMSVFASLFPYDDWPPHHSHHHHHNSHWALHVTTGHTGFTVSGCQMTSYNKAPN